MTNTLLTLGHGYTAAALTRRLQAEGWTVLGTARTPEKAAALRATGVDPVAWQAQSVEEALNRARHLLITAGPDEAGDPALNLVGEVIRKRAPGLEWVGYLSTTGVYGDHGGAWVDEDTPLTPSTRRGVLRVQAEQAWQGIPGLALHIFRIAGIYGPGRGPFAKVRRGSARRIIKEGQVFSRIHVDDIAQALAASIARPDPGAIYNICDDDPAPPQDVIAHAARLLGLPLPEAVAFEDADLGPLARSFYAENKRVSNRRLKTELGVRLLYPDYRAGLAALLKTET